MKKTDYRGYFSEEIIRTSPYPEITSPAVSYTGERAETTLPSIGTASPAL